MKKQEALELKKGDIVSLNNSNKTFKVVSIIGEDEKGKVKIKVTSFKTGLRVYTNTQLKKIYKTS